MSRRRWLAVVAVGFVVVMVGAWLALLAPLSPTTAAQELAEEIGEVDESLDAWVFRPDGPTTTALILYTGARVPPEAYAGVIAEVVDAGFLVVVPRLNMELAILEPDAAADVMDAFPRVVTWAVGGHSLGGVMAARFAASEPHIDGLVLWASYLEGGVDLSGTDLVAASITADRDGLVDETELAASTDRLPPETSHVVIEGGNHAQFGDYGPQRGDLPAGITPAEQHRQVAEATVAVLEEISRRAAEAASGG